MPFQKGHKPHPRKSEQAFPVEPSRADQERDDIRMMRVEGELNLYYFITTICEFGKNPDANGPRVTTDQRDLILFLQRMGEEDTGKVLEAAWLYLVLTPRDTLKSTCLQGLVLWLLVKNPNLRILLYGEVHEQAKKRLSVIKRVIETCRTFRMVYGDLRGLPWNEDMITLNTRTNTSLRESSIETAGLDVVVNSRHFDYIFPDDLHSENNTKTKEQIAGVKDKFGLLQPLLSKGGKMGVAGVFWNDNDLHCQLRDQKGVDKYIRNEYVDEAKTIPRYPNALPVSELKKKYANMSEDMYCCHYGMDPVPKSSQKFRKEYFTIIKRDLVKFSQNYILVDPAGDPTSDAPEKKDSDYHGIVVVGVTPAQEFVFFDFCRARMTETQAIEQTLAFFMKYRPYVIGVEKAGIGNMAFHLKEALNRMGLFAIIEDLMPKGRSKYSRIMALEPIARTKRIYICEEANQKDDFLEEATRFPKAKHDDLIDPAAYILDIVRDDKYGMPVMDSPDEYKIPVELMHLNPISQEYWAGVRKAREEEENKGWMEEFV